MKNIFFMALFLLMVFCQKSAAQVSEKDKSMFVDYYSYSYDPTTLQQLISDPDNARQLQSCIKAVKKITTLKEIKSDITDYGVKETPTTLEDIYRSLGSKISDEYSRKLMPAFNIKDYRAFNDKLGLFKLPDSPPGSATLYQIDLNTYSALINAYSKNRGTGFFPTNAYISLTFDKPELLESLKNRIEGMGKVIDYNSNTTLDDVARYWLEKSFYYKMREDVIAHLKNDISADERNMFSCNGLVAKLAKEPVDGKDDGGLVLKDINDKGKITVIPTDNKNTGNHPPKTEEKKNNPPASPDWAGTYEDRHMQSTITISGSAAFYTGNFEYLNGDSKGTGGNFEDVKLEDNKLTGKWTISHEDNTKKGEREGTFEIYLTTDGIKGVLNETKEPMWQYKEGYSKQNVFSNMGKGKSFTIDAVRK